MKRWLKIMSLIMSVLLLSANMHAISARAANLDGANAAKIASAITSTAEQQARKQGKDYFKTLANGRIIYVKGFKVTNLTPPSHGQLLDTSATVTADSGLSWEVPVIWVDQNGNMLKIALDIDGVVACYPILAFYLPEGYAMATGKNVTYDISMPDFVTDLMAKSGVATLSNPSNGVTYITPLLPGKNKVEANRTTQYSLYDEEETESASSGVEEKPYVPQADTSDSGNGNGGSGGGGRSGNRSGYKKYDPKLSEDEEKAIIDLHVQSDDSSKDAIEELKNLDKNDLAWFISFVKNVVEPEAVQLLEQKFPAYGDAAEKKKDEAELGEKLGLYVYYKAAEGSQNSGNSEVGDETDETDNTGGEVGNGTIAELKWDYSEQGELTYSLGINVSYFYTVDKESGKTVFNDEAYDLLDNTLLHEIMHAHMLDYTRTGMTGKKYDEASGKYVNSAENKFPTWFIEGMGMSVDNPYQYLNAYFTGESDKSDGYGFDSETKTYDAELLKEKYSADSTMRLEYADSNSTSDVTKSAYASGYLANVYLAYLAAIAYDKKDAISEKKGEITIDSKVIRSGMNHILEELHNGKTLDNIIGEISPSDGAGGNCYSNTDEFASKFIASSGEDSDGGKSADFCATLLSYFASNSDNTTNGKNVNGSVLLDFDDLDTYQLKGISKVKTEVYVLDNAQESKSNVNSEEAQKSGGKKDTGTIVDTSDENSSENTDTDYSEQSEEKKALDKVSVPTDSTPENQDNASEGNAIDNTSDSSDNRNSSSADDNKKSSKPSENASDDSEDAESDSSSAEEAIEDDYEETAEFPVEEEQPENESIEEPESEPAPEAAPAPEETAEQPATDPQPAPEAAPAPEVAPEPESAPAEDYTPPSMIISEPEPEPAPQEPASQDNNQEVLDAVKPEPSSNDDSSSSENSGE